MREIKFRAWDKNVKKIFTPGFITNNWKIDYDNNIVLQLFTGLYDSKRTEKYPEGQPIYEGDIITFTVFDREDTDRQYKGVVVWKNGMFEIWHDEKSEYYGSDGGFVLPYVWLQDDDIEVIGNIYENPELLGEKE